VEETPSPIPTAPAEPESPVGLWGIGLIFCAGVGLVVVGLILLLVWRRRERR
jgi:hypothetical protein